MIKRIQSILGKFSIVTIAVFIAKYSLFGILHGLGENIANAIATVIGTVLRYIGHKNFTWKHRHSNNQVWKFTKLEGTITLGEIFLFPLLKTHPIWDWLLFQVGIESPIASGYLVLLTLSVLLTLVSLFYHDNVTFE